MSCGTPVALFGFNRPEPTARVFAEIRRAAPPQLLFVADGPRSRADEPLCEATRRVIQGVDWPCKVQTNFAEKNLGCGHRIASGLDWVFSNVSEAIILEDDCVPCPSFFPFCEAMLARYRNEPQVMHISGSNFLLGKHAVKDSYYFSKYALVWGWATWKRAWQHYDFGISDWPRLPWPQVFPDRAEGRLWSRRLEPIYRKERQDTWDYQWIFTIWARRGLAITPRVNLVSNVGAGTAATHTHTPSACANLPTAELGALEHPSEFDIDEIADRLTFDHFYGGARLRERATWRYRLAKPFRLWRKWTGR